MRRENHATPSRAPWSSKLWLAGGAVGAGLVVAEIALRILGLPQFHEAHSAPEQFHFLRDGSGAFFYVNLPATTITFRYDSDPHGYFGPGQAVDHVTNDLGFRGPEFTDTRTPGTIRLLFLGDSFTFGEGVRFEDTFPEVTRRLLAADFRSEHLDVESYNLGVGGYNTTDELFLLKTVGRRCRPDVVILSYVLNDAEPELFEVDPELGPIRRAREARTREGAGEARPPPTLLYRSRVAQAVWRYVHARRLTRETEMYYHRLYERDAPGWQASRQALHEIAALCRREEIPLVVMVFPILHRLGADYPFQDLHRLVTAAAESDGVPVLDLLPGFRGHRATDLWVHPTDQHPNEIAHRIVAEQLARRLASWPEFRDKLSASSRLGQ